MGERSAQDQERGGVNHMDIKDIMAPIVADMRHKSAEGEVRKLREAPRLL